jgi:putative membrane protein
VEFDVLPAVSSALNAVTTTLLLIGWRRIKRKDVDGHRRVMLTAIVTSALFLVTYVIHHGMHGTHGSSATGGMRVVYLIVLYSHIVLAIAIAILVPRVAWLAFKGEFDRHRTLARITLPIWLYVSVTGIAVYAMAYHLWPARAAT